MGAAAPINQPINKARYFAWAGAYAMAITTAVLIVSRSEANSALLTLGILGWTTAFVVGLSHLHALGTDLRQTIVTFPNRFDRAPDDPRSWFNTSPSSLVAACAATIILPFPLVILFNSQDVKAALLLIPTSVFFWPMLQATQKTKPNEVPS